MRCTELTLTPADSAIAVLVQWVASCGGSSIVRATTRSATEGSSFGMREGRVLSRRSPSTPSAANRSCQRQTQVLDLPVSRMIAFVPALGAEQRDLRAPNVLLRCVAVFDQSAQPIKVGRRHRWKCRFACRRLARGESAGNPHWDSNVRRDPLGRELLNVRSESGRRPRRARVHGHQIIRSIS
jgi:hypothetical protein